MTWHRIAIAWLAPAILLTVGPAHSQVERTGGGEAQRIMQQYQQIASEKAALQGQVTQLKKDLEAAQAEAAAEKKERDNLKAHSGVPTAALTRATAAKETAEKNLDQYKQRLNELVTKFREMAANLRDVEADRNALRESSQQRNADFDRCAESNLQLYEINGEILDRYEHVGLFTKVTAGEPFTRITRTRIENLVDEYRARALELRVKKKTP
jgi:chromosome segregation ATPase